MRGRLDRGNTTGEGENGGGVGGGDGGGGGGGENGGDNPTEDVRGWVDVCLGRGRGAIVSFHSLILWSNYYDRNIIMIAP